MSTRLTASKLRRFRAFIDEVLDSEAQGGVGRGVRALQAQFWNEMRARLDVNPMSGGLHHLDQLAQDVLDGKSTAVLQGTGLALPTPPAPQASSARAPHARPLPSTASATTSAPTESASPLTGTKSSKSARGAPAPSKHKAASITSARKTPQKKSRTPSKPTATEDLPVAVDSAPLAPKTVEGSAKAPKHVREAIAAVLAKAEAAGKKPWRIAYPWT